MLFQIHFICPADTEELRLWVDEVLCDASELSLVSLSREQVNTSETVIRNGYITFRQTFFDYSETFDLQTVYKLFWNQIFVSVVWRFKEKKLKFCFQVLTASTQQQNRAFHVDFRTTMECKNFEKRAK